MDDRSPGCGGPARKFRGTAGFAIGIFLTAWLMFPVAGQAGAYRFGVVPQFAPERILATWEPILAAVGSRSDAPLQLSVPRTIPYFEQEFRRGAYDFAYMNPYHSLMADRAQGYYPIIRDGGRQLYGIVVVRKDSPIRKITDLAGRRVAFPAPNALGASLIVRAELARTYRTEIEPVWAETHSSSYLNVVLGVTDAAGGVMSTFLRQKHEVRDRLRIIYETPRVAAHPIVAHPRVPKDVVERVRDTFLEYSGETEGAARVGRIPMKAPTVATAEDYTALKEMNLDAYVK